ncbi:MAG TPA: L-serine ammonia-lyase, iron-sulfur-dependent, subunit alpha [Clostridia bacterium]|nr:L-serine ammonia-lyase, iron-sulfur-dependent, subunit alpha [Clostridia bacterium]
MQLIDKINEKKYCSIFNEVLGPIMVGPSSSHTAGPTRIGKFTGSLVGGVVKEAKIIFDENGSYPLTYRGQGSDRGFLSGLLGYETSDERIRDAYKYAKMEFAYELIFEDLDATHPNTARIDVESEFGIHHIVDSHSTGGGMFEIVGIDGFDVSSKGDFHELFVFAECSGNAEDSVKEVAEAKLGNYELIKVVQNGKCLIHIKTDKKIDEAAMEEMRMIGDVAEVAYVEPILVSPSQIKVDIPFYNATEAYEYGEKNNFEFWELGLRYEMARSGLSEDKLFEIMGEVYDAMKRSAEIGMSGDINMQGYLSPSAHKIIKAKEKGSLMDAGLINTATVWAVGVMEMNSAIGAIVAAPTAGSAGVIPGSIIGAGLEIGLTKKEICKAMFAAATVGIFIQHQATFAAEVAACQAENGSASSMAAAGVVHMIGGTMDQSFKAAALALQNLLGLVCDPIAGLVDIPCINRNAVSAANSIVSANMVVGGFDPYVPLDEVIQAMANVGAALPASLRCTGGGGLCTTKTGIRIKKRFSETGPQ